MTMPVITKSNAAVSLLKAICKANGIRLDSYAKARVLIRGLGLEKQIEMSSGFAARCNGKFYIFYDNTKPYLERQYIIAHELGHILLGHLSGDGRLSKEGAESEANTFASAMVAQELFSTYQRERMEGVKCEKAVPADR